MNYNIVQSGLNSVNKQISNISNNIANAGTTGFKSSTTHFASMYSGSSVSGVEVANVSQNFDNYGALQGTGQSLDLALEGKGFFVVQSETGMNQYTRAGNFQMNSERMITDAAGNSLRGFSLNAAGEPVFGALESLNVAAEGIVAEATDTIQFTANLDSRATTIGIPFDQNDPSSYNSSYTSQIFDSQGNEHTLTQYFVKTGVNSWSVNSSYDGSVAINNGSINFGNEGEITSITDAAGTAVNNLATNFVLANGANDLAIDIDFQGSQQLGADFSVSVNNANGYASGQLVGVSVDNDGMVYANYSNGLSTAQGMVAVANFTNPQALSQSTETSWTQNYKSGEPIFGSPGDGVLGSVRAGFLENSNVDLTQELVGLISAQRNYQANAKTMSTLNQIAQTLFQSV